MKQRNKGWLFFLVSGLALSACEEALEKPIDNDQVILRAPGDGVVVNAGNQIFYWDTLMAAKKYELEIVTPSFDAMALLIVDTTIAKNQLSFSLPVGHYQWRVRAKNNSTTSRYSATRKLIIQ